MARTWRKGFVQLVILLMLTAICRTITPHFEVSTKTYANNSINPNPPQIFPHDFKEFLHSSKRYQARNWSWKKNANELNEPQKPHSVLCPIDDIKRHIGSPMPNQTITKRNHVILPNSLQPHSRITIRSDADFANQGWPGNGTFENPYLIADLHVRSYGGFYCIRITDTRVYFIISNCLVEGDDSLYSVSGIEFFNVRNGLITNTTCINLDYGAILDDSQSIELVNSSFIKSDIGVLMTGSHFNALANNTYTDYTGIHLTQSSNNWIALENFTDLSRGIYIEHSSNNWLTNNTCVNAARGIEVFETNSTKITYNTFRDCSVMGIDVSDSYFATILGNNCTNSYRGIYVFDASATEIINNTCKNIDRFGCAVYPVNDNVIANNSLVGCGFNFEIRHHDYVADQIIGNAVNQRPLLFWQGQVGKTVPLGVGQIIIMNCSQITVQDQNLINSSIGIIMCFTTQSRVLNNTCLSHSVAGIQIQNCDDITVNNNLCTNSPSGITIDQTFEPP